MENTAATFTLMELFELGGVLMWPLLVYSIVALAIVLERIIFIFYHDLKVEEIKDKVKAFIQEDNYEEAKNFLESQTKKNLGARILLPMVSNKDFSEYRLEKAVEVEAMSCIGSLENGFNLLTALGSLSPLTGFLGTVTGMIGAFRSIAEAADVNAQIVANGIYEALITTVFGLIVAIVAMAAHSVFTSIVDRFSSDVEIACSDLIILIGESRKEQLSSGKEKPLQDNLLADSGEVSNEI